MEYTGDQGSLRSRRTTFLGPAHVVLLAVMGLLINCAPESPFLNQAVGTLVWVDREGREESVATPLRGYRYLNISPDGSRVAIDVRDQKNDVWIWEFTRETLTRLTFDPGIDRTPVWTPDGRRVVFNSVREGPRNYFWKMADGTGTVARLTDSPNIQSAGSFSPDGTRLIFAEQFPDTGFDLVMMSLEDERATEVLLRTEFNERNGESSPDGNWLAYQSDASGEFEVYVRPFPDVDSGPWQVSTAGGVTPRWAPDGRELFYVAPGGRMMAVTVQTDATFTAGNPEVLFEGNYFFGGPPRNYDIAPNGQRFLMIKPATDETSHLGPNHRRPELAG